MAATARELAHGRILDGSRMRTPDSEQLTDYRRVLQGATAWRSGIAGRTMGFAGVQKPGSLFTSHAGGLLMRGLN